MDEKARELLYSQLIEMAEINVKEDAKGIVTKEEFMAMPSEEVLKYVFDYRDNETRFEVDGAKATYYIELPDIDLAGKDLTGTYISRFILSREEEGKRIGSSINLGNTNALINLTDIGYSELGQSERGADEEIIDFEKVDFRGCELFGMLPDEYQGEDATGLKKRVIVKGRENLDERYIERRKKHHLTPEEKAISDRAYERLVNGETLYRMRGNSEYIDLTDYDITQIEDEINLRKNYSEYDIGMSIEGQIEFGKRYYDKSNEQMKVKTLKLMLEKGEIEFVKERFDELNSSSKSTVMAILAEKGEIEFVKERFDELDSSGRSMVMIVMAQKGEIQFAKEYFFELNSSSKSTVMAILAEKDEIEFVKKHFDGFEGEKTQILVTLVEKGEIEFVKKHFDKLYNVEQRYKIINLILKEEGIEYEMSYDEYTNSGIQNMMMKKIENGDLKFVEEHFYMWGYIGGSNVLKALVEKGEIEFIEKYFGELMSDSEKAQLLVSMIENGEIEFVEKHFEELVSNSEKAKVVAALTGKNEMELVKKYYRRNADIVLAVMLEAGKIEFIEEHFNDLLGRYYSGQQSYKTLLYTLLNESGLSNEIKYVLIKNDFIKNLDDDFMLRIQWSKDFGLWSCAEYKKGDIEKDIFLQYIMNTPIEKIEKSDILFVEKYFDQINDAALKYNLVSSIAHQEGIEFNLSYNEYKNDVMQKMILEKLQSGDVKFAKVFFFMLKDKYSVLEEMIKKDELDFIKQHLSELDSGNQANLLGIMLRNGNEEFVNEYFDTIDSSEVKGSILRIFALRGKMEFVKQHFDEVEKGYNKEAVVNALIKNGEMEFVYKHFDKLLEKNSFNDSLYGRSYETLVYSLLTKSHLSNKEKFILISSESFKKLDDSFVLGGIERTKYRRICGKG